MRTIKRKLCTTLIAFTCGVALAGGVATADAKDEAVAAKSEAAAGPATRPATKPAQVDPKADQVLKDASAALVKTQRFSLGVSQRMLTVGQGQKQDMSVVHTIAIERPNRVAAHLKEGMNGGTFVSDGKKMWLYMPMLKSYVESDIPAEGFPQESVVVGGGAGMVLQLLAVDDPYKAVIENVQRVDYAGVEKVNETDCHRLRLAFDGAAQGMPAGANLVLDAWITADKTPLLRRLSADLTPMFAAMAADEKNPQAAMFKDMKMVMTISADDWKTEPQFAADQFTFAPPEGAKKVASMQEMFGAAGGGAGEPHAMLGKPAPDFDLKLLEGGSVKLADHRGKDIVVLDFWATWCGPCVKGLPLVSAAAAEFKDKNVVFYAVNQQEQPDAIRTFLANKNLDIKVPLDADGAIGRAFGVSGIPQTVIIDKAGVIRKVHVGFMSGMENQLRTELKEIMEGK